MPLLIIQVLNTPYQPAPIYPDAARQSIWDLVTVNGTFDTHIGDGPFDDYSLQVTYDQQIAGFGPELVDFLANVCNLDTNIGGTDMTFVYQDASGNLHPLSTWIAQTWVDDQGQINIAYDVTQCNGNNWWVLDANGAKIAAPNFAILGHEMSHAMHYCLNDLAADPEVQARTDENNVRAEHPPTELRNVNNGAKGCGLSSASGQDGFSWSNVCFIVSAAVDSANAERVSRLVGLRDMLMRRSALGAAVFAQLFSEYYQFSPRIAAAMKETPAFRRLMSELVVDPLIDFYEILGSYALGDKDRAECDHLFESAVRRRRRKLAARGHDAESLREIRSSISRLSSRLESEDRCTVPPRVKRSSSMQWEHALDYMAEVVRAGTDPPRTIVWALLSPLELTWAALVEESAGFSDSVEKWLCETPVPHSLEHLNGEQQADEELELLERSIFRSSAVRRAVSRRLAEAYARSSSAP
jgi:hypothetical protein